MKSVFKKENKSVCLWSIMFKVKLLLNDNASLSLKLSLNLVIVLSHVKMFLAKVIKITKIFV